MIVFDRESIERWRGMEPGAAYEEVRRAVYRSGATSSEDFLAVFEDLVERGLFTWEGIEAFERQRP